MFGSMRYVFALCVLFSHCYTRTPDGPAAYAVWGFFCLSGYLMALVLDEKYPMDRGGLRAFALARSFRLLPAYYAACLLMIGVLAAFPKAGEEYIGLRLPASLIAWLNAALPFLPPLKLGEVLAQFPAVRIEVVHYAAMALGLARSTRVALAWWALAAAYAAWQVATDTPFYDRYATVTGSSVAFATGVLVYRLRRHLPAWNSPRAMAAAGLVLAGHQALYWAFLPGETMRIGLYSSLAASAAAVILLRGVHPRSVPAWLARLDRAGGDLSYPVYLTHWAAAVVVLALTGKGRSSGTQLVLTFVLCHLLSWAIFRWVETPGDRVRRGIAGRARAAELAASAA